MSFSGRMLETANYNKSVAAGKMVPTITIAHVGECTMKVVEDGDMV